MTVTDRRERPAIFSTPMVDAVLAGRKTQTRRIAFALKNVPAGEYGDFLHIEENLGYPEKNGELYAAFGDPKDPVYARCPYGRPGDVLYVRESFARVPSNYYPDSKSRKLPIDNDEVVIYRAGFDQDAWMHGWKPSIHIPKDYTRIWLQVDRVWIERLHDISEEDAKAEGVAPLFTQEQIDNTVGITGTPEDHGYLNYLWHGNRKAPKKLRNAWEYQHSGYDTALGSFSSLWHMINANRGFGWDTNPYVWCIEFSVLEVLT